MNIFKDWKSRKQNTIRAEKFELVDSQNRLRAVFGVASDDSPGIVMMDENGTPFLAMGVADGQAVIALMDANSKDRDRLTLRVMADGRPVLLMNATTGDPVIRVTVDANNEPGFALGSFNLDDIDALRTAPKPTQRGVLS